MADSVHLELHFRLLGEDDVLPLSQLQRIIANQQQINLADGASLCTLTPEAHLTYLAAHAILQHGEGNPYLLRYFDLHRFITQTSLAWDEVLDLAVALEWTYVLERALLNAVEYFATPVLPEVFEALISRRPAHEDSAKVAKFQGRWHEWELFHRKLGRVSLRDKSRMIFRELCPTPSYMRYFYKIKNTQPVWPYYVYRWLNRGYKVVRLAGERLASWVRFQIASMYREKP